MASESQRRYRDQARLLGEIGDILARADLPRVKVRLPRRLAEQAVAAWELDDEGPIDPESYEQRVQRHHAGTLGLIGLGIQERGQWGDDGSWWTWAPTSSLSQSPPLMIYQGPDLPGRILPAGSAERHRSVIRIHRDRCC